MIPMPEPTIDDLKRMVRRLTFKLERLDGESLATQDARALWECAWSGFNILGSRKSIDEVNRLIFEEIRLNAVIRRMKEDQQTKTE